MKWASITTLIYVSRKESDVQNILNSSSVNNGYGQAKVVPQISFEYIQTSIWKLGTEKKQTLFQFRKNIISN